MQTIQPTASALNSGFRFHSVLVIDDSLPDRFIAKKLIGRNHLAENIVIKESASEGLDYLVKINDTNELPQIIFLDIRMPEMDGFDFLEKFNDLPTSIQDNCMIYMLTSSAYSEDRKKAELFHSVKGFIIKPLTESELLKNFV